MSCPFHKLKTGLPALPPNIAKLPIDERGYPVPFFVKWIEGKPEFRIADRAKMFQCMLQKLCWVCGQKLRSPFAFTIGPMCAYNLISGEPPSHMECAQWSVKGCPFLAKPHMERRDHDNIAAMTNSKGEMITRNPGVILIWKTKSFEIVKHDNDRLFRIGDPISVTWWREGRPATRDEITESIVTGLPKLRELGMDADYERRAGKRVEALMPTV